MTKVKGTNEVTAAQQDLMEIFIVTMRTKKTFNADDIHLAAQTKPSISKDFLMKSIGPTFRKFAAAKLIESTGRYALSQRNSSSTLIEWRATGI